LTGVIVSGLTEADITSQIPPGRADDPSRRQTELNVPIIRPMKKILTTLTVIATAALGAQGQTTTNFPAPAGPGSFTGMTFNAATNVIEGGTNYTDAILLFGVRGATNMSVPLNGVLISGITLSGQGILGTLAFNDIALYNTATLSNYNSYTASAPVDLNTPVATWLSVSNTVNFTVSAFGGASMPVGTSIFYAVRYSDAGGANLNTVGQNISITAVPEPSAYAAAAGLLALFLWSSRRRLFKAAAGSRSALSGHSGNGVD
jgi:hypothetical protein